MYMLQYEEVILVDIIELRLLTDAQFPCLGHAILGISTLDCCCQSAKARHAAMYILMK